jgi:hypothetical protein
MRPVGTPQSALRMPLNKILSTEANVRLLRVLVQSEHAVGKSVLARQAGLNASGVGRSIVALEEVGIVEYAGSGSGRGVALRREHPLAPALATLFAAERRRFEEIQERLTQIAHRLPGPPMSVWIEGPVTRGTDTIDDPLVVGFLAAAGKVEETRTALSESLDSLIEDLDVTIESRGFTKADLVAMDRESRDGLHQAILLVGAPPTFVTGTWKRVKPRTSHSDVDKEALGRAKEIADLLRHDPGVAVRALEFVRARLVRASANERKELLEWDRLLKTSNLARLRRSLVANNEHGRRLRQTMPFFDTLRPDEQPRVVIAGKKSRK